MAGIDFEPVYDPFEAWEARASKDEKETYYNLVELDDLIYELQEVETRLRNCPKIKLLGNQFYEEAREKLLEAIDAMEYLQEYVEDDRD